MEKSKKVILITGASSGIGEATAKKLAQKGENVVLFARREAELKRILESLPNTAISYIAGDVSKYEDIEKLINHAMEKYGRIDVLFNNAGVMPTAPLVEGRRNEWQNMLDINVTGVLNGIAAVLPIMVKQKSGHIITTDSVAGHVVYPGSAVYCGTKFMVRAVMEGLRQEHLNDNIKSTIISPGAVRTNLLSTINDDGVVEQLKKFFEAIDALTPEQVADAVVFAIDTDPNVSISEVLVRPTKQPI